MRKKSDVKSVSLIEAIERMAASLTNGYNVKITTYTKNGVEVEPEIETNIKLFGEMEMLVNILSTINPDNVATSNISKNIVVNKASKLKADVVNIIPEFSNESLQNIASIISTDITRKVTDAIIDTLHKLANNEDVPESLPDPGVDDVEEEILDDRDHSSESSEEVYDSDSFVKKLIEDLQSYESLDFCKYERKFEDCHWTSTRDGFVKTYNGIFYECISPEAFDKVYAKYYDRGFSRRELLKELDKAGYLYHQLNNMNVIIHGMKFYAIKNV